MIEIEFVNETADYAEFGVSTAPQWTIYAIVNGITTKTTTTPSSNFKVTLSGSESDFQWSVTQ